MTFTKALVTGASSGIGKALAYLLADQRIPLIILGRDPERLEDLAAELRHKVPVTIVTADLLQVSDRARVIRLIQEELPDLVINNAGAGIYGDVLTYETPASFEVYDINATVPLEMTIEAARSLVTAGKKGVIVNLSSTAAFQPFPAFAVYSAAKAFIKHFSESFDCELRDKGVRVLASCPGVVATNFQKHAVIDPFVLQKRHLVMTAEFAAKDIWHQIQIGQTVRVFDWRYRFLNFLSQYFAPKAMVLWLLRVFFEGNLPHRDLVKAPQFSQADKGHKK